MYLYAILEGMARSTGGLPQTAAAGVTKVLYPSLCCSLSHIHTLSLTRCSLSLTISLALSPFFLSLMSPSVSHAFPYTPA